MTHVNPPKTLKDSIHVLAVGAFGERTADILKQLLPNVIATLPRQDNSTLPAMWPVARINVLIAWRPVPRLYRVFDTLSHHWKTPFISATLEAPHLRVGPVVVPGLGACYDCYEKRVLQHSTRPAEHTAAQKFYDDNPAAGPLGYLIPFTEMAAIRTTQIIRQLDEAPEAVAGKVWQLNAISRQIVHSEVVGMHGCMRCGLKRSEAARGFESLQSELAYLFDSNLHDESSIGELDYAPPLIKKARHWHVRPLVAPAGK
jgi:bacteriocin biosynthesis cyclodehydratase domain-containing protein